MIRATAAYPVGRLGREDDTDQKAEGITLVQELDVFGKQGVQDGIYLLHALFLVHRPSMVPLDALLLKCVYSRKFRGVAQWLGHLLWEQDIEGSSPFAPMYFFLDNFF